METTFVFACVAECHQQQRGGGGGAGGGGAGAGDRTLQLRLQHRAHLRGSPRPAAHPGAAGQGQARRIPAVTFILLTSFQKSVTFTLVLYHLQSNCISMCYVNI